MGQFLNPNVNLRSDGYGGSFEARLRFLKEAIEATRRGAGDDMIIGLRLSGGEKDFAELGLDGVLEIYSALVVFLIWIISTSLPEHPPGLQVQRISFRLWPISLGILLRSQPRSKRA